MMKVKFPKTVFGLCLVIVLVLWALSFAGWIEPVRLSEHLAGDGPRAVVVGDTIHVVFCLLDLFYLRSTDNGRTWTEPVVISDTLGSSWPGDITFSNGNIHIGWVVPPHGQIARPQLYHRSSSDGGINWSGPHRVFCHGGINSGMLKYPRLAAIGDTLFISCRTDHELLCFRSFSSGETWVDSTAMESGSLIIDHPQSLLTSQRRLHVIYQLNIAGDSLGIEIYHRYSDDYGLTWSPRYMPVSYTHLTLPTN